MIDFCEENLIDILEKYLEKKGYSLEIKRGNQSGPDVLAYKEREKISFEVKGEPNNKRKNQSRSKYFTQAVGQVILRMTEEKTKYVIVVPDTQSYKEKISKIPSRISKLLKLFFWVVNSDGSISEIEP